MYSCICTYIHISIHPSVYIFSSCLSYFSFYLYTRHFPFICKWFRHHSCCQIRRKSKSCVRGLRVIVQNGDGRMSLVFGRKRCLGVTKWRKVLRDTSSRNDARIIWKDRYRVLDSFAGIPIVSVLACRKKCVLGFWIMLLCHFFLLFLFSCAFRLSDYFVVISLLSSSSRFLFYNFNRLLGAVRRMEYDKQVICEHYLNLRSHHAGLKLLYTIMF